MRDSPQIQPFCDSINSQINIVPCFVSHCLRRGINSPNKPSPSSGTSPCLFASDAGSWFPPTLHQTITLTKIKFCFSTYIGKYRCIQINIFVLNSDLLINNIHDQQYFSYCWTRFWTAAKNFKIIFHGIQIKRLNAHPCTGYRVHSNVFYYGLSSSSTRDGIRTTWQYPGVSIWSKELVSLAQTMTYDLYNIHNKWIVTCVCLIICCFRSSCREYFTYLGTSTLPVNGLQFRLIIYKSDSRTLQLSSKRFAA